MEEPYLTEDDQEKQEIVRTVQLCIFKIGGVSFAVDILQIQEIIKPMEITQIPTTPNYVLGVVNLRGIIIPILKIDIFLRQEPLKDMSSSEYLIVRDGNILAGIIVTQVVNIVNTPEDNITIFAEDDPRRKERFLLGSGKIFDSEVSLLDLHGLLREAKASL